MQILVSVWAGMGNIGDDWLADTALDLLGDGKGLLLEPRASMTHECQLSVAWPRLAHRGRLKALREYRRSIESCEAIIFAGGGWLAGDQGARSPMRWVGRLGWSNIPLYGLGLGLGPFPNLRTRGLGKLALSRFTSLSVRTREDSDWAARIHVKRPRVIGDVAFASKLPTEVSASEERAGVAICMPAPAPHWWKEADEVYRERVLKVAQGLTPEEETFFVHFQQGSGGDASFWEGRAMSGPATPTDAIRALSRARVVLAGRLHAAIAASQLGVQVLPLSYHHKFNALKALGITPIPMTRLLDERLGPGSLQVADPHLVEHSRSTVRAEFAQLLADIGVGT